MSNEQVKHLGSSNFDETLKNSDGPVLVDFWAEWCGPCRALGPTIDRVAEEFEGRATVAKVNVDESAELATRYGVSSIPTVLVFRDGEVSERIVGLRPAEAYEDALTAAGAPA